MSNIGDKMKEMKKNPETANVGSKWSEADNADLLTRIANKESIDDMAHALKRTPGGIKAQVLKNAHKLLNETTIEDAATRMNITVEELTSHKVSVEKKLAKKAKAAPEETTPEKVHNDLIREQTEVLKELRELLKALVAKPV
jgi:hypothetical protein